VKATLFPLSAVAVGAWVAVLQPPVSVALIAGAALVAVAGFVRVQPTLHTLGLAAAAIGVLTASWNGIRATEGATVADLFLLLGALLIIPASIVTGRAVPGYLLAAAALLGISGSLAALASPDFALNALPMAQFLIAMVVVPLLIAYTGMPGLMGAMFVASAAIGSTVAVVDAFTGAGLGTSLTGFISFGREAGLAAHSNHLALAAAMALPFAIQRYLTSGPTRLLAGVAVVVLGVGLLVAGSRAGLLAAALGTIATLWLGRQHIRRGALVIGVAFAIIGLLAAAQAGESVSLAIDRLTGEVSVGGSDEDRFVLYDAALARFADSPLFGEGYGSIRVAHNVYLQVLQAGGVIGLMGLLTFLAGTLRLVDRESTVSAAAAAAMVAWMAAGLVQNAIYDRYLYVPAGILLAVWLQRRDRVASGRELLLLLKKSSFIPAIRSRG
jgi:O-antigen ligase